MHNCDGRGATPPVMEESMKTRKAGIIGIGHVGAHVTYAPAVQGIVDELVLVDLNRQKVDTGTPHD